MPDILLLFRTHGLASYGITTNAEHFNQIVCLPNVSGIELMELGGIIPTSVTTAVMFAGGVKS